MTSLVMTLERQAIKLRPIERERLAERLLAPMREQRLTSIEEAWVNEAEHRFSKWKKGLTKAIPAARAIKLASKGISR